MGSCHYAFPAPLIPGILVKRYKRFFADIELASGEVVVAHCPNTGPMSGVSQIGSAVQLTPNSDPKRKLAYTWEMIQVGETWVGINTSLPNRVIQHGLSEGWFAELAGYTQLRREVAYGSQNSKIDILLTYGSGLPPGSTKEAYVEIKNTTWCNGSCAIFPDTVTTRGQKHLEELMEVVAQGSRGVLIYLINRGDCTEFATGDDRDPKYGQLLRQAIAAGVEILPYRFGVSPEGIDYLGLAELRV